MEWTMYDCWVAFLIAVLVLEIYLFVRLVLWLTVFKKKSIYWDEKQQQIKTKSGKCVWDTNKMSVEAIKPFVISNGERITKIEQEREQSKEYNKGVRERNVTRDKNRGKLKAQLQCGAKGHKMVYEKVGESMWSTYPPFADMIKDASLLGTGVSHTKLSRVKFIFKCSDCGLEITKTAKELTATEKEALRKLKLL